MKNASKKEYVVLFVCLAGILSLVSVGLSGMDEDEAVKKVANPSKGEASDDAAAKTATLAQRAKATTELNNFLMEIRNKSRKRLGQMEEFMKSNDLLDAYAKDINRPTTQPVELTYEQAIGKAVKVLRQRNELPADDAVADDEKTEMLKNEVRANETLGKKIFAEIGKIRIRGWAIYLYLEKVEKWNSYKLWSVGEVANDKKKYDDEMAKKRVVYANEQEKKKAEAQQRAKEQEQQRTADRQLAMQQEFELKKQYMENQTRIREASYQQPGRGGWWGWGDTYGDVHHPRRTTRGTITPTKPARKTAKPSPRPAGKPAGRRK